MQMHGFHVRRHDGSNQFRHFVMVLNHPRRHHADRNANANNDEIDSETDYEGMPAALKPGQEVKHFLFGRVGHVLESSR
jgi:hypothetical protein